MKKITLSSERFFDAITFTVLLVILIILSIAADSFIDNSFYNSLAHYVTLFLLASLMTISYQVTIFKGEVVKGIHVLVLLFKKEQLPLSEINEIVLNQNDKHYYEIIAKSDNHSDFIMMTMPNKNPALKQLELIKSQIELA